MIAIKSIRPSLSRSPAASPRPMRDGPDVSRALGDINQSAMIAPARQEQTRHRHRSGGPQIDDTGRWS